ncbi:MAG: CoA-binding protein [Bacteroidales bacterium]
MKKTVVIGASPSQIRFSYKAVKSLARRQHEVIPIGIREGNINGLKIIVGKPEETGVDTVTLYIRPEKQKEYYNYIVNLQPKRIIFNPGTENPELTRLARDNGIKVVEDCTLIMLNSDTY